MKAAYINYIKNLDELKGVYNKLCYQTNSIIKKSLPISTYILTYSSPPQDTHGITFIQIPPHYGYIRRAFFLTRFIKHHFASYSVVILRQAIYSPLFWFYFRKRSFKLIYECHTKLFEELALSNLPINSFIQKLSYPICQNVIDGKISVTNEIANYEQNLGFKKPIKTISNGITIPENPIGFKPFDGKKLDMIFVSSTLQPWHGLDRLFHGIEKYKGAVQFNLHIVGDIPRNIISEYKLSKHNVIFHGIQTKSNIDKMYSQITLAIGSLGMYRNNLSDGCVLKTREYVSQGVPFIYAYNDTDINEKKPFCEKFSNDNTNINMNQVINFARSISNNSSNKITQELYSHAKINMSWDVKIDQYMQFLEEVVMESK